MFKTYLAKKKKMFQTSDSLLRDYKKVKLLISSRMVLIRISLAVNKFIWNFGLKHMSTKIVHRANGEGDMDTTLKYVSNVLQGAMPTEVTLLVIRFSAET